MNYNKDFTLFARDFGYGSLKTEQHMRNQANLPSNMTPYIIEEREMNMTQMDVFSRLMKDRILFFNNEVNDDSMGVLVAQALFLSSINDRPIQLYINSGGGGVMAGMSLYDTLMFIPPRVEPTIMGLAASMGSILGTIKKLHKQDDPDIKTRHMLKHSRLMIHDIRGNCSGVYSDSEISLNLSKELRSELFQVLSNHSGIEVTEIQKLCDRDYWMTSSKALEMNFIDNIVSY